MKRDALIIFGLIAITLTAFSRVGSCDFVNFDDFGYVVQNPHVTGGISAANFAWAWTAFHQGIYLPLTWLSLMLDASLFGPGPRGFHYVNLAFHIANVVLIYVFFRRATGAAWRCALLAAIFAVHPLRVESVAWVVERKDVLSGFFWILTLLAYLHYARTLRWKWYAATLLLYAATLLSKQSFTTFPFLLVLLDYWPLGRWHISQCGIGSFDAPRRSLSQLILEKLPLLALAAVSSVITVKALASDGAISDLQSIPLAQRLANVPVAYARYLGKMVWFGNLAVFYPLHPWTPIPVFASCLLLAGITAICLWKLRSAPWLIVGWLWFLGVLVPMIGVVQFGHVTQAMADRFSYFSGIGLLMMLVWSIPASSFRNPAFGAAVVGAAIGILVVFTIIQIGYWKSTATLFAHAVLVEDSPMAELNLGAALLEQKRLSEAIIHLEQAVKLNPHKANAQAGLAIALARIGKIQGAISHLAAAAQCEPSNPKWHYELACVLIDDGQDQAAIAEFREAIRLGQHSADIHRKLGNTLRKTGNSKQAIDEINQAVIIESNSKESKNILK